MNRCTLFLLILIFTFSCMSYAEDYRETRSGSYVLKGTSHLRSNFSSLVKRFSRDGKVFYKYTEEGEGDYDKYLNITWDIDAEMEGKEDLLYLLYSNRIIRDKDDRVVVKYEKRFDYDKGKIYYTLTDGKGEIIKETSFPIKGYTTDDATMGYFLKAFVAQRGDKRYRRFYLISNEPRLYNITIKVIGTEVLELQTGKIRAIKLRLIPNFGILTGLTGVLIPPTYVWYSEKPPYVLLQYEGLEAGLGTPHIVAYTSI